MKESDENIRQEGESPFVRFAKTLRGLMGVSKRQLDEQLADDRREHKARQRRGRKRG